MLQHFVSPTIIRRGDYPRLSYPDEGAEDQGVLVYLHDFDENRKPGITIDIYEPWKISDDFDRHKHENDARRAYNLSPYFDLTNDMKLYAYMLPVPGYGDEWWVTLLPKKTSHYDQFHVDFEGTYRDCPQREHRLVENKRIQNGRVFVSLPEGLDYWEDGKELTGEHVQDYSFDEGTFWIMLWNGQNKFSYYMKMNPLSDEEAEKLGGGRTTATGISTVNEKREMVHLEYDLSSLDPPEYDNSDDEETAWQDSLVSNHTDS